MDGFLNVEWQPQRLIVFGPDADRVFIANDVDVLRIRWEGNGIGKGAQPILDLLIAPQSCKSRLLLARIAILEVLEQVLPGVCAEIQNAREYGELNHASEPADAGYGRRVT